LPALSICTSLFAANGALAFEDMQVHQHELSLSGVLPAPYYTISLEIVLDPETDDTNRFDLKIGGTPVRLNEKDLNQLKDVELATLDIMHGIHRTSDSPADQMADYLFDYVVVTVEVGERYRIEYEKDGQTRYHWGRDKAVIGVNLSEDNSAHVSVDRLSSPDRPSISAAFE
jgi:hypothetical protein